MEQFGLALILFAAFWVGCAAGYIAMRLRAQVAYEKGRNESAAEISALKERLNGRDLQFNEARQRADAGAETITRLEAELRQETDRRTVAEARLTLLPKYEAELEARGQKIAEQSKELTSLHVAVSELNARLEESKKTAEDKINAIQTLQNRVAESFQSMSAEALVSNNKAFLDLAGDALARLQDSARGDLDQRQTLFGQIMEPLKSSLDRVDARISELEHERATAYAGLQQQVESMMRTQANLQAETAHLATALRTPSSRGRWGEVQLRRVVELAGMIAHCDFIEPRGAEEGAANRPDMVVQLPNRRQIVVDSKVSLSAYLESHDAVDETVRLEKRRQHAALVRAHVEQLSQKGYWDQFPQSPEFVVAFLPGEAFFSAALEQDPELLEFGVERRVILATPTTLIALLRAVAGGWKQETVSSNAKEIRDLGKALYDRLRTLAENFTEVQRSLSRTTAAFNRTVGTFESNVMPSARRLRELGAATGDEIASPSPVDSTPRSLHLLAEATEVEENRIPVLAGPAIAQPVTAAVPSAPAARQAVPAESVSMSQPLASLRTLPFPANAPPARHGKPNGHAALEARANAAPAVSRAVLPSAPPKAEQPVEPPALKPTATQATAPPAEPSPLPPAPASAPKADLPFEAAAFQPTATQATAPPAGQHDQPSPPPPAPSSAPNADLPVEPAVRKPTATQATAPPSEPSPLPPAPTPKLAELQSTAPTAGQHDQPSPLPPAPAPKADLPVEPAVLKPTATQATAPPAEPSPVPPAPAPMLAELQTTAPPAGQHNQPSPLPPAPAPKADLPVEPAVLKPTATQATAEPSEPSPVPPAPAPMLAELQTTAPPAGQHNQPSPLPPAPAPKADLPVEPAVLKPTATQATAEPSEPSPVPPAPAPAPNLAELPSTAPQTHQLHATKGGAQSVPRPDRPQIPPSPESPSHAPAAP